MVEAEPAACESCHEEGASAQRPAAPEACFDCPAARAIRSVYRGKLEHFARRAAFQLRRRPAFGIFGDDLGLRTLWDEYCFDRKEGPADALEVTWADLLDPIIDQLIQDVGADEQFLLTLAAAWDAGLDDDPAVRDLLLVRNAVRSAINTLVSARS